MSSPEISESEKGVIERQAVGEKPREILDNNEDNELPELGRNVSNALSRVASRFSTRDIVDPGPAPDGGLQAWTQVAMGWAVCFCTWWVASWNS